MQIAEGGIAFFDSGIGGLTVLAECCRQIKGGVFYYYGDNGRAPYGNLPAQTIREYLEEAFSLFESLHVREAVLACNTATAVCVESLRARYSFPVIGTEPAIFPAAKNGGEIFVLATNATCQSDRFQKLCARARERYPHANISAFACPRLAGEIESRLLDFNFDYSKFLPQGTPDGVVLGCTHYIYIKERVRRFYGCEVYDGNAGVAKRLKTSLATTPDAFRPLLTPSLENGAFLSFCGSRIYFLGEQKTVNLRVFEQMFAKPYK
ncbi:MAG: aspartate/glutamate racemase family protein [Clostridia bacterium]|nr:aspartate/glutamate racemase family protein [Clostridia bacterium]